MVESSQDYRETFEILFRLSDKMRKAGGGDESFVIISDELRAITGADFAAILVYDSDRGLLRVAGMSGASGDWWKSLPMVKSDELVRRRIIQSGELVAYRFEKPDEIPASFGDLISRLEVEKVMVAPVMHGDEFLGYFTLGNKKGRPDFDQAAERLISGLSVALAMVIDNVKLNNVLRRSRDETENLLNIAPIGILRCDSKGIFKSVNQQLLKMLDKKSPEELIGTSVFELPVMGKSGLDALIIQAMEGHEGEKADVHIVTRPDRAVYLHVKVTPVRSEGGELGEILLVAMDTTSKVRLQNQLERSYEKLTQTYQELERVAKMKTQFIDVVSHELRTPLTVMRGYIDLMETEYSAKLEPKFTARLKTIKANTDRLYSLVENMLDVSRLEKGSLQIASEPVRLDALLEELVQTRKHDTEHKKQTMTIEIEGRLPLIMADRRRLKDVFNNIVDNAIRYTQEGGRIQVCARDEGKMVHVWVRDNGVGIPLENLARIFDRFHIITSNDLSHQVDRLGLGLPISKGIVEAHGGRIWVESQVGKGSVFHVDLPKESPK